MEEKLIFTGDAKQLEAEYQKLAKAAIEQGNKLDWIAKQAERMAAEFGKASKEAVKANEAAAVAAGKVEVANRRAAQAAEQLAHIDATRWNAARTRFEQQADAAGRLQVALRKEAAAAREAADAHRRGTDEIKEQQSPVGDLVTKAGKYALAWISVQQVLSGVRQHLEDIRQAQDTVLGKQLSVANEQAQVVLNTPNESEASRNRYFQSIRDIAREENFGGGPEGNGQAMLLKAGNRTLSVASGDMTASAEALRVAARLTANNPEQAEELAPSIVGIMKQRGVSAEEAAGFILSFAKFARPAKTGDQAKMAERAAQAGATMSPRRPSEGAIASAALTATLSKFADDEGDTSSTAGLNIDISMEKFFKEGYDVKVGTKTFHVPLKDPGDTESRLAALMDNPKLAKEFEQSGAFGRRRFIVPFREIIKRGSKWHQDYEEAKAGIGFDRGIVTAASGEVRGATYELQAATRFNAARAGTDSRDIGEVNESREANAWQEVNNIYAQTARSVDPLSHFLQTPQLWALRKISGSPEEFRTRAIATRRQQISAVRENSPFSSSLFRETSAADLDYLDNQASPRSRSLSPLSGGRSRDVVDELQKQNQLGEEQLKALQTLINMMGGGQRAPGRSPIAGGDQRGARER